ncbi:MAG TPA: hypothetical protein VEI95_15850 [Acidobacteriota bacterium]|nr:hypothetical protein [Acidobacteriota bacterium]
MIKIIVLALIIVCQVETGFCQSNEIHSFKVIKQTPKSVVFELKYYYSGDHGDKAELTAWPLPPGYWGSSIVPLVFGEHTSQLSVTLGPKVSKQVSCDSIEFLYISDRGPPFYKKEFPFKKTWANTFNKDKEQ